MQKRFSARTGVVPTPPRAFSPAAAATSAAPAAAAVGKAGGTSTNGSWLRSAAAGSSCSASSVVVAVTPVVSKGKCSLVFIYLFCPKSVMMRNCSTRYFLLFDRRRLSCVALVPIWESAIVFTFHQTSTFVFDVVCLTCSRKMSPLLSYASRKYEKKIEECSSFTPSLYFSLTFSSLSRTT